ncbi:MAG: hypothetical protein JO092_01430 [Candidatus Eremiobacteraeota bacterium]|nr:hypothetical protein [Candidatus Eremiobacteraeota bacterium]
MRFAPFSRTSALIAVAAVALSACSGGSLPIAPTVPAATSAMSDSSAIPSITIFAKNPCTKPAFPLICVKQGGSSKLGIKLTCKRGGVPTSCGTITWRTKTSNTGLKGTFKPKKDIYPENSTVETMTASKTIKPASNTYTQTVSWTCSLCKPKGGNSGPVPITVLPK